MPDTIWCDFDFADGLHLQYQATLANSFEGRYEVFCGSNSAIKLAWTAGWMFKEADAPTQGWEVYANRMQFHNDEGITLIADATKLAEQGRLKEGVILPHPPLYYALGDFLRSVLEDQPVVVSAEEGLREGCGADETFEPEAEATQAYADLYPLYQAALKAFECSLT